MRSSQRAATNIWVTMDCDNISDPHCSKPSWTEVCTYCSSPLGVTKVRRYTVILPLCTILVRPAVISDSNASLDRSTPQGIQCLFPQRVTSRCILACWSPIRFMHDTIHLFANTTETIVFVSDKDLHGRNVVLLQSTVLCKMFDITTDTTGTQ